MQGQGRAAEAALDGLGLVSSMHAGVYSTDRDGVVLLVNDAALALLGLARHELIGGRIHDLVHDRRADGTPLRGEECPLLAVIATGQPARSDDDVFWRGDGAPLPVTWLSAPLVEDGDVTGAVVVFTDTTARHVEAERLAAQHRAAVLAQQRLAEANGRLSLLGRLTESLATLDAGEAATRLARLTAGVAADVCVVVTVDPDDSARVRRVALARAEAADVPTQAHHTLPPLTALSRGPLARALGTGGQQVVDRAREREQGDAFDRDDAALLDGLDAAHALVTPLTARRHVLGALTWVRTDAARPFDEADRTLAVEVGRRAGLALENARVHQQQRSAAEALQRSLLTVLPESDDLELVARYLPATGGVEVGGDWYDAFKLADGATSLVIGDIVGHDLAAATRMGQLRNLLRGIAADRLEAPAAVLARLDRVLQVLDVGGLATCVLARVEQAPEEEPTGVRRLRWSSAGHPPPAVTAVDGRVRLLEAEADLMLGVDASLPRAEHVETLQPGETVWLYTDGLVERSDQPLDAGLARLRRTLSALHGRPLEEACDALLARMLPDGHPDDVAVLAVRARPQDRPRPTSAAPADR